MDPAQIYGPYGAIAALVIAVVFLYRENTELRKGSMDLLKKYQDRDAEKLKLYEDEQRERRRKEADQ